MLHIKSCFSFVLFFVLLGFYSPAEIYSNSANFDATECQKKFFTIMDENGAEFADCYGRVETPTCEENPVKNLPQNLILILDSSGSMAAKIKGQTRMEVARTAANSFIKGLSEELQFGVMVYGHKGSNKPKDKSISCAGIETLVPLQKIQKDEAFGVVDKLQPVGYTPLAGSLERAEEILTEYPADAFNNTVILISDGEETCGGDPVQSAQQLNSNASHGTISVIGLDVGGAVETQLSAIAEAGKGQYYSARTVAELNAVLANLAKQECIIDKNEKALEAHLSLELNMMECKNKLVYEKDAVLLEVQFEEDKECQQFMYSQYKNRYFSVKNRLGQIYRDGISKSKGAFGDNEETAVYESFFSSDLQDFQN